MNEILKNEVKLSGKITGPMEFSHRIYGEAFYRFRLEVRRLSGSADVLPVTISERAIAGVDVGVGSFITVTGQLRSYNMIIDSVSRLILTVFCKQLEPGACNGNPNEIAIEGFICKPCTYRVTPFGREITDMLVAVNRNYNKSDYIPCIVWGRNARYASTFRVGDKISIMGRVQAREYEKVHENGEKETRTAYEVSVARIEKL